MSQATKDRILATALDLFNRFGFVNVRLQLIADEAHLSVGNLAYHFANKDALVETIYHRLAQAQQASLANLVKTPLFEALDRYLAEAFALQAKYSFFYLDTLEMLRAYPTVKHDYRQQARWQITQMAQLLQFNVARGALQPESQPGLHQQLAQHYWHSTELWRHQQRLLGQPSPSWAEFRAAAWALLMPHFTPMGQQEYEALPG
ncbi:MAG: TetR/AcrR family transcriptional regulator [Bernardetiaceae bacterium]|jgi:AcrR family transcriptional regulator|nr:TetR/AcrR family transcriptional regulator [Bernardetiaceae bacterium]